MVAFSQWLSPTRIAGLAGYMMSFVACTVAWVRCCQRGVSGRLFAVLTVVQLILLLDMASNWRWLLHDFWMHQAMAHDVYTLRHPPQLIALGLLATAMLIGTILILSKLRQRIGAALALTGTLLSFGLWCAEILSYHGVDAVLYHMVGRLMAVSFLWIALALITSFGAWLDTRSYPAR